MAEWKKTNEAYFGDSFNRDSTLCSAANIHATVDDDVATKAINWNYDGHYGINTLNELCNYAATMTDVETVSNKFDELQAQIDDLKKKLETRKEYSELRSALKTLHYKREVE